VHFKGSRYSVLRQICIIVIFTFLSSAHAELDNISQNAENQSRKKDAEKSRDEINKQTQEHTKPLEMSKMMEAIQHFKKAEDARKQQDEGTAKKEEQMGMMKQMQSQQLNQQAKAQDQAAKANDEAAQKMTNPEQVKVPKIPGSETKVIIVREGGSSAQGEAAPVVSEAPKPPIPVEQLASMEMDPRFIPTALTPKTEKVEVAPMPEAAPREKIGYDENAKPSLASGSVSTAASQGSAPAANPISALASLGSSNIVGGGAGGSAAGGAGGGDFWKGMGNLVEEENQQVVLTAERLNPRNLRGAKGEKKDSSDVPGKGLSDEAFWKKVGKLPAKCKSTTEISKRSRETCLKVARKDFERKWRETQRRPASGKGAPETKPALQAKNNDK